MTNSVLGNNKKHLTFIGVRPMEKQHFPLFLRKYPMALNVAHIIFVVVTFVIYNISISCFLMFEATSFTECSLAGLFYNVSYLKFFILFNFNLGTIENILFHGS